MAQDGDWMVRHWKQLINYALSIPLALGVTSPAIANDWEYVLTQKDNTDTYIQFVRRENNFVLTWVKEDYETPRYGATTLAFLKTIDCNTGDYSIARIIRYNESGRVIKDQSSNPPLRFTTKRGSVGAEVNRVACTGY